MHADPKEQAWVTTALDDSQCLRALVLCRSLRRVFTNRKIAALITKNVSRSMRLLLEEQFDVVLKIDEEDATAGNVSLELYSKIYSWQMTVFKKCIFISSDSLVLENCDQVFDDKELNTTLNLSFFILNPSFAIYDKIFNLVKISKDHETAFRKFFNPSGSTLPLEYNPDITESFTSEQFSSSIKSVRFTGRKPWMPSKTGEFTGKSEGEWKGQFYEILSQVWMNIFCEDVAPKLSFEMELPSEMKEIISSNSFFELEFSRGLSYISKEMNENLNDSIAVIGMGCRFPGANSHEEFWELLSEGRDAVKEVPFGRWDAKDVDIDEEDLRKTQAGFLKCPVDEFDAKFFGISPREAGFMDPQQRLLLEVAWEGLENAGIDPTTLKGSNTGVFVGIWTADYEALLRKQCSGNNIHRVYLGNAYSATSARVSFFLGLNGPNIATESGCSSSFVSIHLASESLRRNECNMALAGGVNLLLHPYSLIGSEKPYFMSGDGHCKTFDAKADGFGRAEGCGMVILKRFVDAKKDGDRILGVIRGSAVNSEGTTASFGTPSKPCQEKVIKDALENAKMNSENVTYVEAHGTGTIVGDPTEVSALAEAYSKGRKQPLVIGSVKTNIGHAEGAAGVAGLIKVLLSMQHKTIPPHRNFESLNPDIDLERIPAIIPVTAQKWETLGNQSRVAGISSFGISGTNVHVIVEEPPKTKSLKPPQQLRDRSHHILTLSAKNERALNELSLKYQNYLAKNPDAKLADVAFTTNNGRAHFPYRMAIIGKDLETVKTNLEKKVTISGKVKGGRTPVAFLFTGQGSQYPGMAKRLYETHPVFKQSLDYCETALRNNLGISILDAILHETVENSSSILDQTLYSQTSIFCIEYSLLQLWKSFGVEPDYVLGHSVGEFAAAAAAGIMSLADALKLVSQRSSLIQGLPAGGMLAVKASLETVKVLVDNFTNSRKGMWLDVAVVNSVEEVVVAGRPEALNIFAQFCTKEGVKTLKVAATHAFHSRDMEAILQPFGKIAEEINYNNPTCGYISGRDGKQLQREDLCSKYWQNHARDSVNFTLGLKTLYESGCRVFVEIGPHPVLLALALTNLPIEDSMEATWLPTIRRNEEEWATILSSVAKLYIAGVNINWGSFDAPYPREKLELPTYPFQRKRYWYESITEANSLTCNTKVLHPLLGRNVPVATNDMHVNIYQQTILLENLPYLSDHQVANKIIMPGAGFFEMILAAGNLAMQGSHDSFCAPKTAFVVEDFVIEAPLEIIADKACRLQTVGIPTSPENSEQLKISIMRKSDVSGMNWKRHASAKFNTVTKYIPEEYSKTFDLELIKSRCTETMSTEEMYTKIAEVGIAFGPLFQTIKEFHRGENEVLAEISCPPLSSDKLEYICHPIILDAMLQAYAFQVDLEKVALYLPVAIEKFYWLSRQQTQSAFLYISWETNDSGRHGVVQLLNTAGEIMGIMKGVRLVKTSIATFVNFLNTQKREVPSLFYEVYRPKVGPLMSRINLKALPEIETATENCKSTFDEIFAPAREREKNDDHEYFALKNLPCDYSLNALYELGWKPVLGQKIQTRDLMTNLLISFRHEKYIENIMRIFTNQGFLSSTPASKKRLLEWTVIKVPPSHEEIKSMIEKTNTRVMKDTNGQSAEIPVLKRCGLHLAALLQEKELPFDVLFPENSPEENASRIYVESEFCKDCNNAIKSFFEELFAKETVKETSSGGTVRILEIGGGVGSTSSYVIETFNKLGIPFSYTFTDISPLLLSKAAQRFKGVSRMVYKVLDIEKDPKTQGFAPHQYDVIVGSNVLHATASIEEALVNCNHLLAPKGYFVMFEMFEPIRHIDMIYGVLDGYWRFRDYNLRPNHPLMCVENWEYACMKTGFGNFKSVFAAGDNNGLIIARSKAITQPYVDKTITNKGVWLIFGKEDRMTSVLENSFNRDGRIPVVLFQGKDYKEIGENRFVVDPLSENDFTSVIELLIERELTVEGVVYLWSVNVTREDQDNMCGGILHFSQTMLKYTFRSLPKVFIITKGMYFTGDEEPQNPTQGLIRGLVLSMKSEQLGWKFCLLDLDPDEVDHEIAIEELYDELWINDGESQVALRQRKRFLARLSPIDPSPAPLIIPNSERYRIVLPESKAISDIILAGVTKPSEIAPGYVECLVKASALNFRDIFVVLKPAEFQSMYWDVGLEFSGVVTSIGPEVKNFKVGDEVFGFTLDSAIGSHCVSKETMVMKKPSFITHAEASTMPTVFFTAYLSLIEIADIKPSDTVLLHVASGGVGIAAIQICQKIGATIIATAGSRRKRAFLRSQGIQHVFHSRNTTYGDDIMRVTNGRGVDIVLNSLTGPNFKETSLKICATNARFIEMSKINIWQKEDVEKLRPDVVYTIVNLEYGLDMNDRTRTEILENLIEKRVYNPLPYIRFDVTQVKEAFMYFQQAHHIGKIVVTMPECHYSKGNLEISEKSFNAESTYLITGGLGGIGLEVAKFMSRSGATHIVLVGRNPPSPSAEEVLKTISSKGIRVVTLQVDIGDRKQCEELFQKLKSPELNLPPLRGIMHAAGFLSDGMINNQNMEKLNVVFNAKVNGAWNLHHFSKDYNLEHFVLYSSAAALLGPMGQANHAAANTFLDTFAHYRHALGLPVQTINWGIWSEVGVAAELALGKDGAWGVKPFSPSQGIAALKAILKYHYLRVAVAEIDINQFKRDLLNLGCYIEEMVNKSDNEVSAELVAEGEKIWKEIKDTSPDQRAGIIKFHIENMIRQTLKLPDDEPIDENQSFSDMGLDSLMAVEMRNKLQMIFGKNVTLNTTALLDNPNISALSSYLANLITLSENSPQKIQSEKPSIPLEDISLSELVKLDSILPEYIKGVKNNVIPSKIQSVLLTGVTGQLGIFVLPQLSQNNNLTIYCVIRAKTDEDAKKRLIQRLKKYKIYTSTNLSNVICLTGNIVDKRLGLSISKYDELSTEVDAIIHCAVKANHVEDYMVQKSANGHDLRSTNVTGTVNILEFAAHTKTKQVLHASSLVAITKSDEYGRLLEELPADDDFGENINWGYATSKFIGEKLIKQAIERGIPCKVLRLPVIVGHSKTGMFAPETNHLMLFLLACMHLEVAPLLPGAWSIINVDSAAAIVCKLLFNDTAPNGAFNVNNPQVVNQEDVVDIFAESGRQTKLVSEQEWIDVLKSKGEDSLLFSLQELYLRGKGLTAFLSSTHVGDKAFQGESQGKILFGIGEKLAKIMPGIEQEIPHSGDIFRKHLEYAEKSGVYKMFGIA